jgi:hypothetical protein
MVFVPLVEDGTKIKRFNFNLLILKSKSPSVPLLIHPQSTRILEETDRLRLVMPAQDETITTSQSPKAKGEQTVGSSRKATFEGCEDRQEGHGLCDGDEDGEWG